MTVLPLFPLNTVLFPNMPLRLHIFEERYKAMINECVETKTPFGVVLIEEGEEALGPVAQPHLIGCTAQITQVQRLPFGRMNIIAIGRERFKIRELHHDKAYLSAAVDMWPIDLGNTTTAASNSSKLRPLVQKYLVAMENSGQIQINDAQIPTEPMLLAYLAAVMLQTDAGQKQLLLESVDSNSLINELVRQYKREVALLEVLMTQPPDATKSNGPFSLN